MNQAKSNDRSTRFHDLLIQSVSKLGETLAVPNSQQLQLVITDGVMRLLDTTNNGEFPLMLSSNPKDSGTYVGFTSQGAKLLINGIGSRGQGSRVSTIIGLGREPDESLLEEIEAMIVSLRYPLLNPEQVKKEHRELLARYGYIAINQ